MPTHVTYEKIRLKKWFRNCGTGAAGQLVTALYVGIDEAGNVDRFGEGQIGATYIVVLLNKSNAILAPCPDFCENGESPTISEADKKIIKAYDKLAKELSGTGTPKNLTKKKSKKSKRVK